MIQYCSPLVGQSCRKKLNVLKEFCADGMQINAERTKFIGISTVSTDPLKLGDGYITRTQSYCYLKGNVLSKTISQQVKEEVEHRRKHGRKFGCFLSANNSAPFYVKCDALCMRNVVDKHLNKSNSLIWAL